MNTPVRRCSHVSPSLVQIDGDPVYNSRLVCNITAFIHDFRLPGFHKVVIIGDEVVIFVRQNVRRHVLGLYDVVASWFCCMRRDPVTGKGYMTKPSDFQKKYGCAPYISVRYVSDKVEKKLAEKDFVRNLRRHLREIEVFSRRQAEFLEREFGIKSDRRRLHWDYLKQFLNRGPEPE